MIHPPLSRLHRHRRRRRHCRRRRPHGQRGFMDSPDIGISMFLFSLRKETGLCFGPACMEQRFCKFRTPPAFFVASGWRLRIIGFDVIRFLLFHGVAEKQRFCNSLRCFRLHCCFWGRAWNKYFVGMCGWTPSFFVARCWVGAKSCRFVLCVRFLCLYLNSLHHHFQGLEFRVALPAS